MKKYWSMTEGVFNCLIDTKRTIAFRKAINKTVKKGDVVVDMGTGTGILAILAVDAGAKKVYAVEYDKNNIITLQKNFELNGYKNVIEVLEGDVTKIALPEKVDVIIGEMIATALIEELQIPAMNNMLKYAKVNVKVLLNKYECFIDLVANNDIFYGKKFNVVRYEYADEPTLISIPLSKKHMYASVDFSKINIRNTVDKSINFTAKKSGTINGLRLSSKTVFYDKSSFDDSFAYSYPIILPVENIRVKKGDIIVVHFKYEMCKGFKTFSYEIVKKQPDVL